ncbi:hypothetical protein SAMN04487944_108123 [Gracilibacillus ureilyticus]|uniref:Uncharacterized protein n=1 Tax=Gracilibacillus ureilyticus TaxID=531814 RepID=A0A1H9RD93_9BACI|nr:hypothetical protein [Gracilibacillus ureilyticus]SER70702.1 hypothetical protein SAMN04487944_108123 [Gracilibacillus ureilyticus]
MTTFRTADLIGSIPNNGMYVQSNKKGSGDVSTSAVNEWKMVFGDEARKINPLFDVKIQRNELIQSSIAQDDWSAYNAFEATQHPAWYEEVNGVFEKNKIYYGNLIESKLRAIKDAEAEGDQEKVELWENSLNEAIQDFNNAPGIVPYVVGLNHNEKVANEYGVEEPADDFFASPYNASIVLNQGKFESNQWFENAIFEEDPELKVHIENLVADKSSVTEEAVTEGTQETDNEVQLATEETQVEADQQTVASSIVNEADNTVTSSLVDETNETDKTVTSSIIEEANKENTELSLHQFLWNNVKDSIKPDIMEVMNKYKIG